MTDADGNTEYQREYDNVHIFEAGTGVGGADVLYGGAGNDWLFGQKGDDILTADGERDRLIRAPLANEAAYNFRQIESQRQVA